MTRLYARSPVGTRAFGRAPRNWGENVTILGALTLRGPLAAMYVAGATTGPVFLTCLDKVLLPQLWKGAVVVMDNLSAHKVKAVRENIEAAGARLLYLSPYSPDFNPIEPAWSKLKSHLRKSPRAPPPPWTPPSPRACASSARRTPTATSPTAAIARAYSNGKRSSTNPLISDCR